MTLSEFLETTGFSPMEFGKTIGLEQPNSIYRYLRGERIPNAEIMHAITVQTTGLVQPNDFYHQRWERLGLGQAVS